MDELSHNPPADRSYRGRKDKYTRCLEQELAKARSYEAELTRECGQLRTTLQNALHQLAQQSVNLPPEIRHDNRHDLEDDDCGEMRSATESFTTSRLAVLPKKPGPIALGHLNRSKQAVDIVPSPQLISPESLGDDYYSAEEKRAPVLFNSTEVVAVRMCDQDQITVGMEFVLKYADLFPNNNLY